MNLLNIGFGNFVSEERIVTMLSPESAPIKRMVRHAAEEGSLVDASFGRKTMTVIIADSGHIILSSLLPEAIYSQGTQKTERTTDE